MLTWRRVLKRKLNKRFKTSIALKKREEEPGEERGGNNKTTRESERLRKVGCRRIVFHDKIRAAQKEIA